MVHLIKKVLLILLVMIGMYPLLLMTKNGLNVSLVKTFVAHYHTFRYHFHMIWHYVTRKIVEILMGTNCSPLVADFLLFYYGIYFMMSLSYDTQADK